MRRLTTLILVMVVCASVAWVLSMKRSPGPAEEWISKAVKIPLRPAEPRPAVKQDEGREMQRQMQENIEAAKPYYDHRIDFYGIVLDEKNSPVPDATVTYMIPGSLVEALSQPKLERLTTGADGCFRMIGRRGAEIIIGSVSHPDYYQTNQSRGRMGYAWPDPKGLPTREKPVQYFLRRRGDSEPLLRKEMRQKILKDGTPVAIALSSTEAHDVTVRVWTDPEPATYAWRMRIEIPGGGLLPYEGEFEFVAPPEGYVSTFEFSMPVEGINGDWSDECWKYFFVHLPGDHYARMSFRMIARGGHFAVVESYYNPSGSRNLEFDPKKAIAP